MKFGKQLLMLRVLEWAGQYISYSELKVLIEKDEPPTMQQLVTLIEEELVKVDVFAQSKFQELKNSISLLLRELQLLNTNAAEKKVSRTDVESACAEFEQRLKSISHIFCHLESFTFLNKEGFRKITKKYDKVTKSPDNLQSWMLARLSMIDFANLSLNSLLVSLSTCYSLLRKNQAFTSGEESEQRLKASGVWKPPESFQRDTTKFWVRRNDITAIKLKIIQNLPVLLFGESPEQKVKSITTKGLASSIPEINKLVTSYEDSSGITSLYLDSDDLSFFHSRIRRDEGANLVRVRWYGSEPPSANKKVFMERKTHHESWVQEDSIKERFDIPSKDVRPFLDGTFKNDEYFTAMVQRGEMKEEKATKQCQLADETQTLVQKSKAHSLVRTSYNRTAFQSADDNKVRISLDTDLILANEDDAFNEEGRWFLKKNNDLLNLEDMPTVNANDKLPLNSEQNMKKYTKVRFPYAILEIKLQTDAPEWVNELQAMPGLIKVHKFSKFLTGCAVLYPERCKVLPHWFEADGNIANIEPTKTAESTKVEVDLESVVVDLDNKIRSQLSLEKDPKPSEIVPVTKKSSKIKVPPRYVPVKVEPKTFFANERTFIQWLGAAILMLTLTSALIAFDNNTSYIVSYTFFPVAMLFLVYALVIYHWRASKIRQKADGPYDDRFGPTVLVVVLLMAAIANLVYTVTFYDSINIFTYSSDQGIPFNNEAGSSCKQILTNSCRGATTINGMTVTSENHSIVVAAFGSVCELSISGFNNHDGYQVDAGNNSDATGIGLTGGFNIIDVASVDDDFQSILFLTNASAEVDGSSWLFMVDNTATSVPVAVSSDLSGFVNTGNPVQALTTTPRFTDADVFISTPNGIMVGSLDRVAESLSFHSLIAPFLFGLERLTTVSMTASDERLYVLTQSVRGAWHVHVVSGLASQNYVRDDYFEVPGTEASWSAIEYDSLSNRMLLANKFPTNVFQIAWNDVSGFAGCR